LNSIARLVSMGPRRDSPGSRALLQQVLRVISLLRVGLATHAVVVNAQRGAQAAHPGVLVAAMIVLVAWTGLANLVYARPRGRSTLWLLTDVAVTSLLAAVSPWILGATLYERDFLPVPVFWSVSASVSLAAVRSVKWGVAAALAIATARFAVHPGAEPALWSTYIIMIFVAGGVGIMVDFLLASLSERDRAFAQSAALAERERLNRIVHDGVLQVLALVEREGPGLGPRGVRLAQLAQEQEVSLRVLLQDREVQLSRRKDEQRRDLTSVLDRHSSSGVTVSMMADEVLVDPDVADEVDAVVTEILANVRKHAGENAQAWLLLESEGNEVIVSVRDNGVGTTRAHLDKAAEGGHLGVKASIVGRVRDLGGQAHVRTSPGRGVEWELRIPVS